METPNVTVVKKGGWSGLSTTNKTLIIVTATLVIGGVVYFGFIRKKDEEVTNSGDVDSGKKETSKSDTESETKKDDVKATTTEVKKEVKTTTPTSTNTTVTTTTSTTVHDIKSLPNGGKDCGQVHTNFDRDFDYIKCGGAWWTKSKPNAANPSKRGSIPDWKNISANKIATQRLDARYPKG